MNNKDIRDYARIKGVKLWQIANKLGINDGNFSRRLRNELSEEKKKEIFEIIDELHVYPKEECFLDNTVKKAENYPTNLLHEIFDEEFDVTIDVELGLEFVLRNCLTEKQYLIVKLRFVEQNTFGEIGEIFGVTRNRVRQIVERSISKMRNPKYANYIKKRICGTF